MQIHTIRAGESLWGIAQAYGSTIEDIVTANQLPNPGQLVIGQTIVVPIWGRVYWVQSGDTLWAIARKFGVTESTIAQLNGINIHQPLQIGMKLRIPPMPKIAGEFLAYIEPLGSAVSEVLLNQARETSPMLTYLALFSYEVRSDGSLKAPTYAGIPDIAKQHNTAMMLVVSNLQNGQFNGNIAKDIFQSTAVQDLLVDNIIKEAKRLGDVKDIHFDLEALPADQRTAYNRFLRRITPKLHTAGYTVSTALVPKTSDTQTGLYGAYDYKAHGEVVDFVLLMTYEWGYISGPPMAISPIREVEKVVKYAVSVMPPKKIMMGQNLYGYDWTLPYEPGGKPAVALSPQTAIERAAKYHATIQYDQVAQAPYFQYVDEQRTPHIVWFEDAKSIQAKFNLVKQFNIRGVGYWKLGLAFPQNWLLIEENFRVVKK